MSISSKFPAIKPSLNLDFANTKQLDPRITFTRASTATYFDRFGVMQTAAANVARFDHDPSTGESLGLLIEEQRTNLLTYSEDFTNAAWVKNTVSSTADATVAPDGTLSADQISAGTTTQFLGLFQTVSVSQNTVYTFSFWVKRGSMTAMTYRVYNATAPSDIIPATSYYALTNSSGFTRISASFTTPTGCTSVRIYPLSDVSPAQAAGAYFYIWGAQLESGAFPTSYIPNTASQVTRSADAASMTGTNFSSWYRADEGTLYGKGKAIDPTRQNAPLLELSSASFGSYGAYNIQVGFSRGVGTSRSTAYSNSTLQADILVTNSAAVRAVAFSYAENNFSAASNGTLGIPDTSGVVPQNLAYAMIGGAGYTNAGYLCGWVSKLAYYPKSLSNENLQALTS